MFLDLAVQLNFATNNNMLVQWCMQSPLVQIEAPFASDEHEGPVAEIIHRLYKPDIHRADHHHHCHSPTNKD